MNDPETNRCEEYSRILFGKSVKGGELNDLVRGSASFEDFRIRVVHKFANRNEHSKKITMRWHNSVAKAADSHDANSLLHMLENLALKQIELERRMREATVELLEKLKALDAHSTAQAAWRTSFDEIRNQMAEIRSRLEHLEEVPSRGGNGSK
jgi:hypothetical protein